MESALNSNTHRPKLADLHWLVRRTIRAAGMSLALGAFAAPALAQQTSGTAPKTGSDPAQALSAPAAPGGSDSSKAASVAELRQVVVTGTMLRGVRAPVGASLITIGPQKIAETGAQTVQQVLENNPAITGFGSPAQGSQGSFDAAGTYAPTIHGLGASASNGTLVLVDGQRMVLGGITHTLSDPNIIAPLMIQSIQILPNGASSTYGSDAVAGVINIITRKNFKGFEATGQYGFANGYNAENGGVLWGDSFGNTSVMASINYEQRSSLGYSQRAFSRDANYKSKGGANFDNYSCSPASAQVGKSFYLYPYTNGPASEAGCTTNGQADLLPQEARTNVMVKLTHVVNDNLSFNGSLIYSNEYYRASQPRGAISATAYGPGSAPPGGAGQINPFFQGPPGATSEIVNFNANSLLGRGAYSSGGTKTTMGRFNAIWDFSRNWEATFGTTVGESDNSEKIIGQICGSCFDLAVNGTTNASGNPLLPSVPGTTTVVTDLPLTTSNALNVWSPTGAGTSTAVLGRLADNSIVESSLQTFKDVLLKIDGPVFHMPAGSVKAAVGAEYLHYGIAQQAVEPNNTGPSSQGSIDVLLNWGRDVKSAFAEVLVPVFGGDDQAMLLKRLTLDISGRIDNYSDVGSTENPRFAVDWSPVNDLTIRGDYSRTFAAPALTSIGDNGVTVESGFSGTTVVSNLSIPNTFPNAIGLPGCTAATPYCTIGNASVPGMEVNGPNANLKPETGKSWSFGFTWTPHQVPGLTVDTTFWNVEYFGMITSPLATFAISSPALSPLLTLFPSGATPGQIAALAGNRPQTGALPANVYYIYNYEQQNAIDLEAKGIDSTESYVRSTSIGTLSADLQWALNLKMAERFGSSGSWFDVLNTDGFNTTFPTMRIGATLDLGWARSAYSVHLITNYEGSYYNWNGAGPFPLKRNAQFQPIGGGQGIPSLTIYNAFVSYAPPKGSPLHGAAFTLTVNNLLDTSPPFYNSPFGYDSNAANPIGREAILAASYKW
ncbi:MAG: TonB-dependent receptor [Proteobacteria bacterium]|nr:TonB-dependent receptor [Pseudomonadota bacterium]